MKLKKPQEVKALYGNNLQDVENMLAGKAPSTGYADLLRLLGDLLDTIAAGQNAYAIIGATKDQSTFSVTVVSGADRASVYAGALVELSLACQDLL